MSNLTKSQQKKQEILAKAVGKEPRPSMQEDLGRALNNYTSAASHSYDAAFANEVRALRPDWFRARSKKTQVVPPSGLANA